MAIVAKMILAILYFNYLLYVQEVLSRFVTYYIKWVKISWAYSMPLNMSRIDRRLFFSLCFSNKYQLTFGNDFAVQIDKCVLHNPDDFLTDKIVVINKREDN